MKVLSFSQTMLVPLVLAVAILPACSGGSTSQMVSPTAVPASPTGSGTLSGTVVSGTSSSSTTAGQAAPSRVEGITITVVGTGLTASADVNGAFVIQGVPAATRLTLHFSGSGADADLTLDGLADGEVRHITVQVEGSTATLADDDDPDDANEPGDANEPDDDDHGESDEIKGSISAIDSAALTITVVGKTISVPAGTPIERDDRPITFGDLKIGDRVEVDVTATTGALVASKVEVETDTGSGSGDDEADGSDDTDEHHDGGDDHHDGGESPD